MIFVPFFEIHYGDRLAKNVKSLSVQVIPRSTVQPRLHRASGDTHARKDFCTQDLEFLTLPLTFVMNDKVEIIAAIPRKIMVSAHFV